MPEATQPGADSNEATVDQKLEAMFGRKPEEPADESDATPDTGAQEQEAEGAEQESAQDNETGAGEASDGPQIELAHIAAALGVEESMLDVTDDGVIVFKAKVDQQELTAKAADILKGYQLEGTANKRLMEAAEQRKAAETFKQQLEQAASQRLQQLDDTLKVAHGLLMQKYASVPWDHLKATDPSAFMLKRQEFADDQAQVQQLFLALESERQGQQQRTSQELAQKRQQELDKLLSAVPDWKDPAKFEQGRREILTGAAEFYGFQEAEVGNVLDHRLLLMARDAMAYRNLKKSQPEVAKKVRLAPKVAKPGQPKSQPAKDAQLKAMRDRIKKSGGTEGVEDYLRLRGLG